MTQIFQQVQPISNSLLCLSQQSGFTNSKQTHLTATSTLGQLLQQLTHFKTKTIKKIPHKNKKASWTKAQTQKLAQLCKVFGSDFSLIALYMQKTRDQIKRRFKYLQKIGWKIDIFSSKIVEIQ